MNWKKCRILKLFAEHMHSLQYVDNLDGLKTRYSETAAIPDNGRCFVDFPVHDEQVINAGVKDGCSLHAYKSFVTGWSRGSAVPLLKTD
jgi:hypothetical protein